MTVYVYQYHAPKSPASKPCWASPVAEDMKSWRRDRSQHPAIGILKSSLLSLRVAQTHSPGSSASASSQDCFVPWSTFMAWGSSTATLRGVRDGLDPDEGSGCRDGTVDIPGSPSSPSVSLCLSLPTSPPLGLSFFCTPSKSVFLGCVSDCCLSMNCLPVITFVFLSWCFPNKHPASLSAPGH